VGKRGSRQIGNIPTKRKKTVGKAEKRSQERGEALGKKKHERERTQEKTPVSLGILRALEKSKQIEEKKQTEKGSRKTIHTPPWAWKKKGNNSLGKKTWGRKA